MSYHSSYSSYLNTKLCCKDNIAGPAGATGATGPTGQTGATGATRFKQRFRMSVACLLSKNITYCLTYVIFYILYLL
jgi:hypothetical protein